MYMYICYGTVFFALKNVGRTLGWPGSWDIMGPWDGLLFECRHFVMPNLWRIYG